MPIKIIPVDARFYTGEPSIQLVATWGRNSKLLREDTSLKKVAAYSPAMEYIRTVEPEPGKSIILVIALSAGESNGPNRNGDHFPAEPIPDKIEEHETLPHHYKSFETAKVYKHHVNHDPEKAIGSIKKAFWNDYMKRVELIEDVDHKKAPDIAKRILDGEYLPTSMGTKIAYDVCSMCGNRAKTRKDYCDHLKYEMGRIYPDGKIACALNPSPRFFDQSFVLRPADRTAYMIKKVASETIYELQSSFDQGELVSNLFSKLSAALKAADIEKVISNEPIASSSTLGDDELKLLKRYNKDVAPDVASKIKPLSSKSVQITIRYEPSEVLSTTEAAGMPMALGDMVRYFVGRMSGEEDTSPPKKEVVDSACKHASLVLDIFSAYPRFFEDVIKIGGLTTSPDKVNTKLAQSMPTRSALGDLAYRSFVPEAFRDSGREKALTDPIDYTSPTGQPYTTTYGVVRNTNDAIARSQLKRGLIGAGTLFGVGSMANSLARPRGLDGPIVYTSTGEPISGWTEMLPKAASELIYALQRNMDSSKEGLSKEAAAGVLEQVKAAEINDELTELAGPTLDFEKVAWILDESILNGSRTL